MVNLVAARTFTLKATGIWPSISVPGMKCTDLITPIALRRVIAWQLTTLQDRMALSKLIMLNWRRVETRSDPMLLPRHRSETLRSTRESLEWASQFSNHSGLLTTCFILTTSPMLLSTAVSVDYGVQLSQRIFGSSLENLLTPKTAKKMPRNTKESKKASRRFTKPTFKTEISSQAWEQQFKEKWMAANTIDLSISI